MLLGTWYLVQCNLDQSVWHGPIGVGKVQLQDNQISSSLPCFSDELCNNTSMHQAARYSWNPPFLHRCVDVTILENKLSQASGQDTEKYLALYAKQ